VARFAIFTMNRQHYDAQHVIKHFSLTVMSFIDCIFNLLYNSNWFSF